MSGTTNCYKKIVEVAQNKYVIASYQRGYRWDETNVTELLEDVFEGRYT